MLNLLQEVNFQICWSANQTHNRQLRLGEGIDPQRGGWRTLPCKTCNPCWASSAHRSAWKGRMGLTVLPVELRETSPCLHALLVWTAVQIALPYALPYMPCPVFLPHSPVIWVTGTPWGCLNNLCWVLATPTQHHVSSACTAGSCLGLCTCAHYQNSLLSEPV